MHDREYDFEIETLGNTKYESPMHLSTVKGDNIANYTTEQERVLYHINAGLKETIDTSMRNTMERAGPREFLFFNPEEVHAGVVTCGGLCPGLNDVIRSLVRTLWEGYGVKKITGIKYGYNGLLDKFAYPYKSLNRDMVGPIHSVGGSYLGSSRGGGEDTSRIVDNIQKLGVNIIFIVGGDGTQKGAMNISEEAKKRKYNLAVIGVPKTIDNDLRFTDRSFGFETAVSKATDAIKSAHQEAEAAFNGIGVVKLMGRNSGFIAAHAALASHEANFVLVPEVPFELEGKNGFFTHLKKRLQLRFHAVVVVAEGAGIDLFKKVSHDASGNISFSAKNAPDIGTFLSERIVQYFKKEAMEVTLKYINPSYIIRSSVALPTDSLYCTRLASNAVHAGMAGKTNMMISMFNNTYVHLPLKVATAEINTIDPESTLWRDVVSKLDMPLNMTTT